MSDPLAHYSFLPWLRRGISTKIAEQDALGAEPSGGMSKERANMEVGLTVSSNPVNGGPPVNEDVIKTFRFIGPPDVLAVSAHAIVRTEPKAGVNNYEANGLPYIEFYEEDFLWSYTPAGARTEKLTPWLALVCLKDDEYELKNNSEGRAYITINDAAMESVFHNEQQHWAWAHVHLNTELTAGALPGQITEVTSELAADPDTGVSRLICPRKLIKETGYTAFLIPAYETGRLSGLGLPYTNVFAQKMSWKKGDNYAAKTRGFDYPVYHFWKFRTGLNGDFESLARLLKAVVSDPELGKRDMYIDNAGYGLEDFTTNSTVLGVEGALKPPQFTSDAWPNGAQDTGYRTHLRKLLNLSIDNQSLNTGNPDSLSGNPFYSAGLGNDPIVTPEIYGRWHALATRLQNGSNYSWVNHLNLDPRNRAAAGLGTQVIKNNQEDFMQRAWKQVEQVNEANKKIRKATIARFINHALYSKHIAVAKDDQLIRMTSAVHAVITSNTGSGIQTIHQTIHESIVPDASQSAAFKKITRPGKKSNQLVNTFAAAQGTPLLHEQVTQNFNAELIKTAPVKEPIVSSIGISSITSNVNDALALFMTNDFAMATQGLFESIGAETNFDNLNQVARKNVLKNRIDSNGALNSDAKTLAKNLIDGITSSVDGGTTVAHLVHVSETAFNALFNPSNPPALDSITAKVYGNIVIDRPTGGQPGIISRATTTNDITAFQTSLTTFETYTNAGLISTTLSPIGDTAIVKDNLKTQLNQKDRMLSRMSGAVRVSVWNSITGLFERQIRDSFKPVMAYPKIDDPMFRELKKISQEYILPNLNKVPVNSITLLQTNQAFIEGYMAGLNHEFSRELLWREYPTDQRGSYFRQFWDISDTAHITEPEDKYDIRKMTEWTGALGSHSPRTISASGGTYLVLLIRGELLKKYPNTQVYAHKAQFNDPLNPDAPRTLADETVAANLLFPVFMAELDPDIYLFGFDLDIDEAKGDSDDASKPGWFFVLRERPGQIRFGLDDWTAIDPDDPDFPTGDPTDWNDLSWEHFVASREVLNNYQLDVNHSFNPTAGSENLPLSAWGRNAADVASILYQNPVLFARHAQEMLPD
jgi:hypothetical protein